MINNNISYYYNVMTIHLHGSINIPFAYISIYYSRQFAIIY